MKFIDDRLNKITMYRVVLDYLLIIVGIAMVMGFFHIINYDPIAIGASAIFITLLCVLVNEIISEILKAPVNNESAYISGLILALIINPPKTPHDFIFLFWAAVIAMSSKYIFAIGKKHLFNPVALAVVITAFVLNQSASWWIGNLPMMPFVFIGGLLIMRKIRREDLVFSFFASVSVVVILISIANGNPLPIILERLLLHSSLFFFAFVMLTEPLTTPPTKSLQIAYGALCGFLFVPQIHIGSLFSTPELALVTGNIFSYLVSPKQKLVLFLKEKIRISPDTFDFIFSLSKKLSFRPGQYMEWTLAHKDSDIRGNRRYFTIASSPTEDTVRIGVKFYNPSSSFKKALFALTPNTPIIASQLAGDFSIKENSQEKYVFIAGGIGITPFRSILHYLIDRKQKENIILLYSNKMESEITYKDVFDRAQNELGIKTVYALTDETAISPHWTGRRGRINAQMIVEDVPDYKERTFYISGPHGMVVAYENVLKELGVNPQKIKVDYFPGFA